MEPKSKIAFSEKSRAKPKHRQKQGISEKVDFSENPDFNENPGKHNPTMESQTVLKVGARFVYPVPAAAPASQGVV